MGYERVPQGILFAFADDVIEPTTVENCLAECQERATACQSALYFYAERQCILNQVTKDEQPELFDSVPPESFLVDYFQKRCAEIGEFC